ncbi:MAG: ribosome maturation factor RimM [Thermoanaerobaculia bacterium]
MKKPSSGSPRGRRPPIRSAGSSPRRPDPAELVVVGRVVKPHGIRGEASVEVLTDFPDRFRPGRTLGARSASGEVSPLRIATVRPHGRRLLLRFEGIATSEAVEKLREVDLCAFPGDEPDRPEGYVFQHEAIGLAVVAAGGERLGTVRDLIHVAGRPVLILETARGVREVPFSRPIVVAVDLAERRIVLDPPAGLLD